MTPPLTVEQIVTAAWIEVLGTQGASPDDTFFESGGHSFAAVQLMSAVEAVLDVQFPLECLFTGTLKSVVAECQARLSGQESGPLEAH